jgi:diacylglycerol kinase (ATP)
MARYKFIVNPAAAGGRSAKRWVGILSVLRESEVDFEYVFTTGRGDATRLAREAASAGYRYVVSVGGDGTCNEIVNGLMAVDSEVRKQVRLGIVPTGRGVDFCRSLGLPLDPRAAALRLLADHTMAVDIGEAEFRIGSVDERRYFVNFAGMGFDVEVTRRSNALSPKGRGTLPYLSAVFVSVFSYRNKPMQMVLDGQVVRQRINMIIVANGRYFGGGMRIAPAACPTDGLLDIVVLGDVTVPELIWNLARVYDGSHIKHPKVETYRAERIEVSCDEPVGFQLDGDPLGELPVKLRVLKSVLNVLV